MLRRTLNLGILAHVDAGKTTLTERLLYAAGVIDEVGSVDKGSTQTDTLALEQQRGITIKSAVVSFAIGDVTVNLIDTPGHPDFIAEVERVLSVLDGAVLVISGVEGVQPQTRILMRALQRLRVPTLLFVNKLDRPEADPGRVRRQIADRLTSAIVPLPVSADGAAEVLAERDEDLLALYLDDQPIPERQLEDALARQSRQALVHPVFFGSARTGAGVGRLMSGIEELLPAASQNPVGGVSGSVFKIERGPAGEKIAFIRMFSGTVRVRDRVRFGRSGERKVTAISVFDGGSAVQRDSVRAGEIAKLWGLGEVRIGDAIGRPRRSAEHHFAPPTLETVIVPRTPSEKGLLRIALAQLAEQDPLIDVRQDDEREELSVSLYGEVQKEVIQATLASDHGLEVGFRETTTICVERPIGTGAAVEQIRVAPNPFLATVGLRVEPAPAGGGIVYRRANEVLGTMPRAFFKAVEETVHETLRQGLYGWQVTDCVVTLTHTGYYPRQSHAHQGFSKSMSSTAGDFRDLTPLVLMTALRQAGTVVYGPIDRFELELPADTLGPTLALLATVDAVPGTPSVRGETCTVEGDVPASRVHELRLQLAAATRGEGVLEVRFDRYEPANGSAPTRPRSDDNPLNREEYLLRVAGRV